MGQLNLGIADAIESHGSPMTLLELAATLECDRSTLHLIMRFLVHLQIFKEYHGLSALVRGNGMSTPAFEAVHGEDVWSFAAANPGHSKLIDEAMTCDARVAVPAVIASCIEVFQGIESIVDMGGDDGTSLSLLVEACPWITKESDRVVNVGGDMFDCIPKADAGIIKSVLHDWGDEECICILRNCREALPKDKGKVIILEAIIEEVEMEEVYTDVRLMMDMVMMAHTNAGKERTLKEWEYVIGEADFSRQTVTPIDAVQSVIQAFV